jgi:probable HAF family extracellular repeat protein
VAEHGGNSSGGLGRGPRAVVVVGGRGRCILAAMGFLMAAMGPCRAVFGQCSYEIVILPTPNCYDGSAGGFGAGGIRDDSFIVGGYGCVFGPSAAAYWDGGIVQLLPNPPGYNASGAVDVNWSMQIVGNVPLTGLNKPRGVIWEGGVPTILAPPPNGTMSSAWAINEDGTVVGRWGNTSTGPGRAAAVWLNGQISLALYEALGSPGSSGANDINDDGAIVGWMGESQSFDAHAYVFQDGQVLDLGVIPGGYTAEAHAINNHNLILGIGRVAIAAPPGFERHAFVWEIGVMVDLSAQFGLGECVFGAVNDLGQAVAYSQVEGLFMWHDGELVLLRDRIPAAWLQTLTTPTDINNIGQIVDAGANVILQPVGWMPGDVDRNCTVNVQDLLTLLGEWGNLGSFADTNADGFVNVTDLLILLANWG